MVDSSTQAKLKSFWQRPEGKTGIIFMIGIAIVVILFANPILAFIITLLQNLITTIVLFVVLGIILYIILDPKVRTLVWYMYKSFMRWLTGIVVQIDPIKILETYIEFLYKNLKEMDDNIAKLKGQMSKMSTFIEQNKKEMEDSLKIAEQAKKKNNMEMVAINTRQYGRLKETNEKYINLLNKMELLYRVLSKIYKNSEYLIKDTENEVRMRKQEAQAIRAGYSAMKRAMSIISGDPDKKMIFDMANEALVDDVSQKIGEMQRFIEISGSFIDTVDLQNAVYEQNGLELLEKMEKDGVSFLLGDNKPQIKELQPDKEVDANKEIGNISNYTNLFQ
jgi:hypothetical protein